MKKKVLLLALLLPLLGGCGSNVNFSFETNEVNERTKVKGTLGDFSLLSPMQNGIIDENPVFSWTPSENAISYTLEVSQLDTFPINIESVVYMKQTNISGTSFKLSSELKTKDIDYYWRVTAVNPNNNNTIGKEKMSETHVFRYKSKSVGEIPISMGEDGDWTLHKEGSYADIKIDRNNFFGSGDENTLRVKFDTEDTKRDIPTSDGWIVVTKAVEQDLYGTNALFFNLYYAGDDAKIIIRLIDADGEYWYKDVQVSKNSKQTVLLKFSDFVLRTKDTTVQNEIFNFEHIQNLEIVFEQSFGDGCLYLGNMRAVNFEDYKHMFISKVDFSAYPLDTWIDESYKFKKTISEDGYEVKLEYSTTAGFNDNEKGIGSAGYGFAKVPLHCYFFEGNALRVKIKYSGYSSNVKAIIRVYEEDTDRWSYEQPYAQLSQEEFTELTIPFCAFGKSQILGDGNKQFYFIENLQLGANNLYGSGSITYKDIEIVTLPSVINNPIEVKEDGIIDNFDSYKDRTETYLHWESSAENKDESIVLNSQEKFAKAGNIYAGQFNYKSDMSMATYDAYTDVEYIGGNALKFLIKDGSKLPSGDSFVSYLSEEEVTAKVVLQLALKDGRWYRYVIEKAPKKWTEYTILFTDFELYSGIELEDSIAFSSENVVNFAFGLQYFYYDGTGKSHPIYSESNPVYMDDIMFTKANESKIEAFEVELHPVDGITTIDTFENYSTDADIQGHWMGLNGLEYEKISLSDEVSSEGGNHSMKLDYKGASSPSYATYPAFGSDVQAKALQFDIKGDGNCTIYINLYVKVGTAIKQYRHTISNVEASWNRYLIGLDSTLFSPMTPSDPPLNIDSIRSLQRLTFGVVGPTTSVSSIYIDNILADSTVRSFLTHTITPLA